MKNALIACITACALTTGLPTIAAAQEPAAASPPAAAPPATDPPAAGWDEEPIVSPPPPRVDPATAPPADAAPPPQPPRNKAGKGLIISGATLVGIGATSLLFVAGPSAIAKRVAMNEAESDSSISLSSQRQHYNRARGADNTMEGAFWFGISVLVVGTALAIAGGVMKSRARSRAMARMGGTAGGFAVRF